MHTNFTAPRALLATLVLFFGLGTLSAQLNGDIKFGVQLSPTFSSMSSNNNLINGDGTNLGLKLGLIGEYYIADQYSIHSGIGFHFNAGGTLRYDDEFSRVDIWQEPLNEVLPATTPRDTTSGSAYKYSLQYLEIPLGLTLRTRDFGYLSYYVRPALHLGILTQSRGEIGGYAGLSEDERFNISSEVNAINLSWSIGGGVEYAISESTGLIAGIAYQSGFADVTTDNDTSVTRPGRGAQEDDSRGKVNSFVITLGVMF
ncbi:porin family protein [Neolewinella antarctica]|uniref:Outer membrane protein beta-barrel domain-containing protein n=1 Tax=Neolewinella antarctica TaxID=442734 RepID=A0ABX0XGB6_9BACT|nr:porin family protein [Neolewinella antarctica]NJC27914.1 hypothetical protein [Neolewinella antarctica]